MNQNRLKTINALNWGKTTYNTSAWMFLHIRNRSKLHKTFITSNSPVIATDKIVNFFSFVTTHMCNKFFHCVKNVSTYVARAFM